MKLCNFHVRVIMVMTSYDNKKFWNVLQGVHILGELHLERRWTGNRGNFRHPGWESPVSGHWPVDREHGTPQGRAGMSELTPGTYRWMTDTYIVIYIVDSVTLQFSSNAFTLRHWLLKVYRICFHKTTEFESPSLVSMNLFGKLIHIALIGRFHYFQREVYQSKTNLL